MKPRLIILSDLWGSEKSEWVNQYIKILEHNFDIKFYDCCDLGNIEKSNCNELYLHNQFVNGGIEIAVENLLKTEKGKIEILAFSVGGTISWKAALKGLNVSVLIAVSSTRLRYETEIPSCRIKLYFGEEDINKPSPDWFEKYCVSYEIYSKKKHEMYLESDFAKKICEEILKITISSSFQNIKQ